MRLQSRTVSMSPMDEDFFFMQELSRLPGHPNSDDRNRYRVIAVARLPVPMLRVSYAQRSGGLRIEDADIFAIIESIYDVDKRYLSGWYDGSPVNYYFEGIQLINDARTGQAYSLDQVAREMFEPPIDIA